MLTPTAQQANVMILVLGEILFDLFPDYRRIGGAPFNFAFHLTQLGFEVAFVSRVGKDALGEEILSFVREKGLDPSHIQVDADHATGTVDIAVTAGGDHRFSIVPDRAYDHLEWNASLDILCAAKPEMVYFGTLIQRSFRGQAMVNQTLAACPEAIRFCDINLRPDCWTRKTAQAAMASAQILKLNIEELDILAPPADQDPVLRARALVAPQGPSLVILTQGEKGAVWITKEGALPGPDPADSSRSDSFRSDSFQANPSLAHPSAAVADTVGAGDAYAAISAAGRLAGLPDRETLALAQEFAGRICTVQGALPQDMTIYHPIKERLRHDR